MLYIITNIIHILFIVIGVLISVAYLTLAERKFMSSCQRRIGPNLVGVWGLLQPFADVLKLLVKEALIPSAVNKGLYIAAPVIMLILTFSAWAIIPFAKGAILADLEMGILFILAISSLSIYGLIFAGWSANSKYALFGALRSTAQMISYEVSIGLILLTVIFACNSLNLTVIIESQKSIWFVIPLFPLAILFFISALAEVQRAPFDLLEAESELVAGFFTEHGALSFGAFMLSEYGSTILMSTLTVILFFGGYLGGSFLFGLKVAIVVYIFVWIRATFPRYRYFDLMQLGWKNILPITIGLFVFVPSFFLSFDWSF